MDELEHADLLRLERLSWLRDTMERLYALELAEPGSLSDWQVMALHASTHSWVTSVMKLDVPA